MRVKHILSLQKNDYEKKTNKDINKFFIGVHIEAKKIQKMKFLNGVHIETKTILANLSVEVALRKSTFQSVESILIQTNNKQIPQKYPYRGKQN